MVNTRSQSARSKDGSAPPPDTTPAPRSRVSRAGANDQPAAARRGGRRGGRAASRPVDDQFDPPDEASLPRVSPRLNFSYGDPGTSGINVTGARQAADAIADTMESDTRASPPREAPNTTPSTQFTPTPQPPRDPRNQPQLIRPTARRDSAVSQTKRGARGIFGTSPAPAPAASETSSNASPAPVVTIQGGRRISQTPIRATRPLMNIREASNEGGSSAPDSSDEELFRSNTPLSGSSRSSSKVSSSSRASSPSSERSAGRYQPPPGRQFRLQDLFWHESGFIARVYQDFCDAVEDLWNRIADRTVRQQPVLRQYFMTLVKYVMYAMFAGMLLAGVGLVILAMFLLWKLAAVFLLPFLYSIGHAVSQHKITTFTPSVSWPFSGPATSWLPTLSLPDNVVRDIHNRLTRAENNIITLQSQQRLHQNTLVSLYDILPNDIAGTISADGSFEFPPDFWPAIRSHILGSSGKQISVEPDRSAEPDWNAFLARNEARLKDHISGEVRIIHNDAVRTRTSALEALQEKYLRLHHTISDRAFEIERRFRDIETSASRTAASVASSMVRSMSGGIPQRNLPNAQIDALAAASQRHIRAQLNRQIDFLSIANGAVVAPGFTSRTITNPFSWIWRLSTRLAGGPSYELLGAWATQRPWEEVGDCWCTPIESGNKVAQVTYSLGMPVIPTSFTIEHISVSTTLQPGLAPRTVELWVRIKDPDLRAQIVSASDALVTGGTKGKFRATNDAATHGDFLPMKKRGYANGLPPSRWVRIARDKYDIHAHDNVQSFGMLVDLKKLNVAVSEVAVRVLDNWGHKSDTCLYRVRLHGELPEDSPHKDQKVYTHKDSLLLPDDSVAEDDERIIGVGKD